MGDVRNIARTVLKKYVSNLNEGSKGYSGLSDEEKRNIFNNFVNTARQVHNNPNWIYDFNKFSGMSNKFEICCETHNECWNSIPKEHLKGKYTCKSCDFWPIFINNVKKVPKYVKMGIEVLENGNILKIGNWEIKKENVNNAHSRIKLYCTKDEKYFTPIAFEFYKINNPSGGCNLCNLDFLNQERGILKFQELYDDLKKYCSLSHYRNEHSYTENARVTALLDNRFTFRDLVFDYDIIFNPENWSTDQKESCEKIINLVSKESRGQKQLVNDLKDLGITDIETEKTVEGLIKTKKLRFDVYLPKQNIYIEYDGIQHYQPIDFYGGMDGYAGRFIRDSLKNDYILKNNLKLIRITYEADLKNIKEFLKEELNNPGNKGVIYYPRKPKIYNLDNYYKE